MFERIGKVVRNPNSWIIALTGLYLVILATRVSEYFFGPDSWQWHGRLPAPGTYGRWWPALLLLGGYVAVALFWMDGDGADGSSRRREWLALAFLVVAAPAIQLALKYIHFEAPVEFYLHRTIGPHNGFWQVASAADDVGHFLRTFPEQMQAHPFVRTPTHPPGDFVYVWLWRRLFQAWPALAHPVAQFFRTCNCTDLQFVRMTDAQIASALAQVIIPALSGLTAVPLYFFGKGLGGARVGFRAGALFVIVPSLTLFTMR